MKKRERKTRIWYETVPLSGGFMLTSILGFLVSTIYMLYGRLDVSWGVAFDIVFLIMFISSVVSITPTYPKELKR